MSTPFYDLASLVVVPSGYKSGKVYAQKPLTTDGQLTFSRASTATRVNSAGLIETVSSNVPRLDYLGSTCPKLQLEPQRTNLLSNSSDFSTWTYIGGGGSTADTATAPDGTTTADTVVTLGYARRLFTMAGGSNTFTLYAKAKDTTCSFRIGFLGPGDSALSTEVVSVTTTAWQRITVTYTNATAPLGVFFNIQSGDDDIYLWGAQLEAGAYATSYIPTLGAAVTRGADACSKTGISSLLSASEYTLFWEGSHIPTGQYNSFATFYNDANQNLSARFYRNNTNNELRAAVFNNAVGLSLDFGSGVTTQTAKCALRVKAGSYAFYVNGALVNSNTSALAPASTLDSVTIQYFNDTQSFDQKTGQVLFFKTALSNADLAALTA